MSRKIKDLSIPPPSLILIGGVVKRVVYKSYKTTPIIIIYNLTPRGPE